jgi:pimeloyl-ACP methyl ester carboxylesterase
MRRLAAAALLVALAGCGDRAPAARDTSHLVDTPLPPPPQARAARLPAGHRVRFRATDGTRLTGTLYPARTARAPAVVLVHGVAGGPRQWDAVVHELHRAGLAAFTYRSRRRDEADPALLARDVAGAVRALGRRRVALAGASAGGSAVLHVLATSAPVAGGVALSPVAGPRTDVHDLLLIIDARERTTAERLAGRGVTVEIAPRAGHGSVLLRDSWVRARIVGWLRGVLCEACARDR